MPPLQTVWFSDPPPVRVLNTFGQNIMNGLIDKARTRAKQSLLLRSWSLQSDREIPGGRQNLETTV